MKTNTVALIALIALLTSCTLVHTNSPTNGHATYASLGGNSEGVTVSPTGSTLANNNNSESFQRATTVAGMAYGAHVIGSVAKTAYAQSGMTDRAGIAAATTRHGATTSARVTTHSAATQAGTTKLLSNNSTAVQLAEIEKARELGLKSLDVPAGE